MVVGGGRPPGSSLGPIPWHPASIPVGHDRATTVQWGRACHTRGGGFEVTTQKPKEFKPNPNLPGRPKRPETMAPGPRRPTSKGPFEIYMKHQVWLVVNLYASIWVEGGENEAETRHARRHSDRRLSTELRPEMSGGGRLDLQFGLHTTALLENTDFAPVRSTMRQPFTIELP